MTDREVERSFINTFIYHCRDVQSWNRDLSNQTMKGNSGGGRFSVRGSVIEQPVFICLPDIARRICISSEADQEDTCNQKEVLGKAPTFPSLLR